MIFSHVLYQLSYLALTKNPSEPPEARTGSSGEGPALPAPRSRPQARTPRIGHCPEKQLLHPVSLSNPNMGSAALWRRSSTTHSGGGIRTRDLRVMSPTSYQAAPPRISRQGSYTSLRRAVNRREQAVQGPGIVALDGVLDLYIRHVPPVA
jgi:hypothetical protein